MSFFLYDLSNNRNNVSSCLPTGALSPLVFMLFNMSLTILTLGMYSDMTSRVINHLFLFIVTCIFFYYV